MSRDDDDESTAVRVMMMMMMMPLLLVFVGEENFYAFCVFRVYMSLKISVSVCLNFSSFRKNTQIFASRRALFA